MQKQPVKPNAHLQFQPIATMKAIQLIELAAAKNLGTSRKAPGIYEIHEIIDGKHITTEFVGTWAQFVKHVKAL